MGQPGQIPGEREDLPVGRLGLRHESHRGDPHDAAAALGVVDLLLSRGDLSQGRKTRQTGGTASMQAFVVDEFTAAPRHPTALGGVPVEVGEPHFLHRVGAPLPCAEQPFQGEQRHLGVVGDRAEAVTAAGGVVGDAPRPEVPLDVLPGTELDGSSQCVPGGPGQQATPRSVSVDHDAFTSFPCPNGRYPARTVCRRPRPRTPYSRFARSSAIRRAWAASSCRPRASRASARSR